VRLLSTGAEIVMSQVETADFQTDIETVLETLDAVERALRGLWHESVGVRLVDAARLRVAANFVHNARTALGPGSIV
jgi:hypothetical protein